MNVLSLFDGMSCGQLALGKAGIKYENYFASEVDKYAIKVSSDNFPEMIHLGDVTKIDYSKPKKCPSCNKVLPQQSRECPECAYVFESEPVEKITIGRHIVTGKQIGRASCRERV